MAYEADNNDDEFDEFSEFGTALIAARNVSIEEALSGDERVAWIKALVEEIDQVIGKGTL